MFSRDNEGKNTVDGSVTSHQENDVEPVTDDTISREELMAQNEEARKIFEDIKSLRESVESLKNEEMDILADPKPRQEPAASDLVIEDTEEILAAKQAIIEQARKDAEEERRKKEEARRKELARQQARQEVLEAQKRAALIEEEAERKRRQAAEAGRRAKAISRKQALDAMEAELQAKNEELAQEEAASRSGGQQPERRRGQDSDSRREATPEEKAAFFGETSGEGETGEKAAAPSEDVMRGLEDAKQELLMAQKQQGEVLGTISQIAEKRTEKLAEEQQRKMDQQQSMLKVEQEKLQQLLEAHRNERLERAEREKAERELREQRAKVERLIKEERARAAREEKLAKARKKREERLHRAEEKERQKRAKKEAAEKARLERERLKQKSIADAELGGGVVNVKGVKINTKIKDTLSVSLKDFIGLADRQERKESSEEKAQQMKEEREKRREEAREAVELSVKQKLDEYERSSFGKKMRAFKNFCERHKVSLLTSFSIFIMLLVGVAGVFNYYTAYAYSYNGQRLGLVKEKDDVLRITDLVQSALTEDKNVDVVMDDIEFDRVSALGDVKIDSSEDVLKRLSYMGNLNVKAYGIYVNGEKVGAVENKDAAANVLQDIKDRYSSGREGAEVEEAVFIESVDIRKSNTDLEDVSSEKEMVEKLCTSGEKEVKHQVVAGETLADIAKLYSVTEEQLLEENPDIDQTKLEVGSVITFHQTAPVLTVRITEMATYEKEVPYETEERDDPDMYQGDSETSQQGENGLEEVTSRIVLVNGEQVEETPLVTTVKKEAVPEIIMVGSKERPPSVGSGNYIWPLSGGYTLTSNFGGRWGRAHEGIDLGVSVGSDVLAADGGIVTYAGYNGAYGYLVIIDHQNGMETRYAHNSSLLVSKGDEVFQGMHIAESGNSGRSTGPHLHFEIRVNGVAKNPLNYLP